MGYGTIGHMDHIRPRLTPEDMQLIIAALRARLAMAGPSRSHRIERLVDRLSEHTRGNPKWILDEDGQTHEEDIDFTE